MRRRTVPLTAALLALVAGALPAQTLKGSKASVRAQHQAAREHDYTFLASASDVRRFVDLGLLVPVRGSADYELVGVSFPYARPALRTFIERLSAQYRAACGERLVVTSLTRPEGLQPRNASSLSVHPAGMAVDLRRSTNGRCRSWLESTLLSLERGGVLDATRESRPPHYHVAVFPRAYENHVAALTGRRPGGERVAAASTGQGKADAATYRVKSGDTLWGIARRLGTTVDDLRGENDLASTKLKPGQVLRIPVEAR